MSRLLEAADLSRAFDGRLAVEGLTLQVGAGEILALLGPNGAGKTTTFRMLAGLLLPTRGRVTVAGESLTPATADRVRRHVGLLTETPGLWERLSVRANLLTYAALHGLPDTASRVARLMTAVGIADRAEDRAGALSKGLKQRVAIARALVHDPQVVLLDEPTAGLDPASARDVRDLVHGLRADGRAVLVSTHNLAEAEDLADRIAVLNTRLLACDTPRALREQRRSREVSIDIEGGVDAWTDVLVRVGAGILAREGDRVRLSLPGTRDVPDVVAALVSAGARLRRVTPIERTLEEAYLDLVRPDA